MGWYASTFFSDPISIQSSDFLLRDHEVADQSWKADLNLPEYQLLTLTFRIQAGTADSNDTAAGCGFSPSGACFTDRKLAGVRAYHEVHNIHSYTPAIHIRIHLSQWMPIRQVVADDKLRIWRNFQIGKLLVGAYIHFFLLSHSDQLA
jgi:alkaline phosphatase D